MPESPRIPTGATLRIPGKARGKKITVRVNGHPVPAFEGETVFALLTAHGIYALGHDRKNGRTLGGLCGMGVCYQCRVTINGVPDQQACTTPVEDHMEIETHAPVY